MPRAIDRFARVISSICGRCGGRASGICGPELISDRVRRPVNFEQPEVVL